MQLLQQYLFQPRRWKWGGVGGEDCTTFCASWVKAFTGQDPAAGIRGTYYDSASANRLIADAGGLVPFVSSRLLPLGYASVLKPQDGDIGAVYANDKLLPAIRFGPLWALMSARGTVVKKLDHQAVWSFSR